MELLYISKWGEIFNIFKNNLFQLQRVDGLTDANVNLATDESGGEDGDRINNARTQPRQIAIYMLVRQGVNVERAKRSVLSVIKLKHHGVLRWTYEGRTWQITGMVESISLPRFEKPVLQIILHCENPYWEDINNTLSEINDVKPLHYFSDDPGDMLYFPAEGIVLSEYDFSRTQIVYNAGDADTGMIIEVVAYKTVTNPIITNQNGEFFGVGSESKPLVMSEGDKLVINTNKGEKSVKLNNVSIFDYIRPNITWLQLYAGENEFSVNSDDEETDNMTFRLTYKQRYV